MAGLTVSHDDDGCSCNYRAVPPTGLGVLYLVKATEIYGQIKLSGFVTHKPTILHKMLINIVLTTL